MWSGLGPSETLHVAGTEPFWSGTATSTSLLWQTPDNQQGQRIEVTRFSGRNGMGLSGQLDGKAFDLAVSEAPCSDGMSDRRHPFTVTVKHGTRDLARLRVGRRASVRRPEPALNAAICRLSGGQVAIRGQLERFRR